MLEQDFDGAAPTIVTDYTMQLTSYSVVGFTVRTVVGLLTHMLDSISDGVVSPSCVCALDNPVTLVVISPDVPIMLHRLVHHVFDQIGSCQLVRGTYALAHLYPPWVVIE